MNKRLNKLIEELGIDHNEAYNVPVIRSQDVKERVNDTLNAIPSERKIYMRHRIKRTVLVAALVAALGASSVFAAVNSDFLRTFFTGDTSYLDGFVQTPRQSVTDERFTLTLEQVLATTHQAFIIYSVEALTDETRAMLNAEDERGFSTFIGMDTISFGVVDPESAGISGNSHREIRERRTDNKRYFALSADILNEDEADFFIRLNKMTEPQNIVISMTSNVETRGLVLGDEAVLQITPLGIAIERRNDHAHTDLLLNVIDGLFFRMSNGEIVTYSQLVAHGFSSITPDEENSSLKLRALFREIVRISDIESVILGDTEFNFHDTSITTAFTPDSAIKPFELVPYFKDHLRMPLRELTANIGATLRWDNEATAAVVEYRNSTFVIAVDSTIIVRDGEAIDFYDAFNDDRSLISSDGRLVVSHRLLDLMGINTVVPNMFNEDFSFNEVENWVWIVIP
ncbi:MAG: copper amine oxidase N-terminal domain-containing protein [Oscillospiraceae bacterium]|nr:copper amine oxidase N-terminal domain-containing protein [Oscillospiraceae bacterium]